MINFYPPSHQEFCEQVRLLTQDIERVGSWMEAILGMFRRAEMWAKSMLRETSSTHDFCAFQTASHRMAWAEFEDNCTDFVNTFTWVGL